MDFHTTKCYKKATRFVTDMGQQMAGIEDREDAFEKKFAHDQEIAFKIEARCCKLLGLWAAAQMGLKAAEADKYAKELVSANLDEPGLDDVRRKLTKDLADKKVAVSAHVLERQIEKCMAEAREQVMKQP
jgi:hypothetical protein